MSMTRLYANVQRHKKELLSFLYEDHPSCVLLPIMKDSIPVGEKQGQEDGDVGVNEDRVSQCSNEFRRQSEAVQVDGIQQDT